MDELIFSTIGICLIVLFIQQSRLKSRLNALEIRRFEQRKGEGARAQSLNQPAEPSNTSDIEPDAALDDVPEIETLRVQPTHVMVRAATTAPNIETRAVPSSPSPPRAFVFNTAKVAALSAWLRENWVLAIAAASLAFAGVFMVQYGIEHGMLTPFWRVMASLSFGVMLIVAGEWIRRRHGDDDGTTAFLPSTLSGAGLIVLFAGVLTARVLYDLISPGTALTGLCGVAVLAIVLGWFYGPVLAAVGIIGATTAPFLVRGETDTPWIFYYYFVLVAVTGLAIDTVRRWAWVSALVLIATLAAMALLYLGDAGALHFVLAVLLTSLAALTIPVRKLFPNHGGVAFADLLTQKNSFRAFPEFPTRIAFGVTLASSIAAAWVASEATTTDEVWLAVCALILLLVATLVWMVRSPALYDHALVPGAAFLATLMNEAFRRGPLYQQFHSALEHSDPEVLPPDTAWIIYTLTALGVVVSGLAFWRMRTGLRGGATSQVSWALAASVFAPTTVLILEFLWQPALVLEDMPWALCAITVAAMMTLLAERCAIDADSARLKLRVGLFAVAALTMIALALFLLLTNSALTLALAVMVLLTSLLDRKYNLPVLGWFLQLGVAVISYRLIFDPGLFWAIYRASLLQALLAYGGTIALLAAAWAVLRASVRLKSQVIVESALWTIGAVFVCVLLFQLFDHANFGSHWGIGLLATVWLASAANQAYRLNIPDRPLRWLRIFLCAVFALFAFACLGLQFAFVHPLEYSSETVLGPPVFDSLAVAYLPVAVVFAVTAWKLSEPRSIFRNLLMALSGLYGATYVGLEIRRVWRGRDLSVPGVTDAELYSYTLAMLTAAMLLLMLAFSRRSVTLRKLAMSGVALTIAKVFLIDMSNLSGLTRVFSFMGLGLALVTLAWLNRKMTAQWDRSEQKDPLGSKDTDAKLPDDENPTDPKK